MSSLYPDTSDVLRCCPSLGFKVFNAETGEGSHRLLSVLFSCLSTAAGYSKLQVGRTLYEAYFKLPLVKTEKMKDPPLFIFFAIIAAYGSILSIRNKSFLCNSCKLLISLHARFYSPDKMSHQDENGHIFVNL